MAQVTVGENEPFDAALRRFNKRVQMDGILSEAKRRRHFEKPSDRRRREEAARARKLLKRRLRSEARMASRAGGR